MCWKINHSLLLALLLQILLIGSVIAERGAEAPGFNNGTQDEKGGFGYGVHFYDHGCSSDRRGNARSKDQPCGFAVCCIHARSTGQQCSLALVPRPLSNTRLDVCSPGPDMHECSFARCCDDGFGLDPGGSDCYNSISPLQGGAGAERVATMLNTVLAAILSGLIG